MPFLTEDISLWKVNDMKRIKKLAALVSALAVCLGLFSGCTYKDRPVVFYFGKNTSTIFEMAELECTESEALVYLMNSKNIYGTVDGTNLWQEEFNTEVIETSLKDAVMSHLIKVFVLDLYAMEQGVTLNEEELSLIGQAAADYYDTMSDGEKLYTKIKGPEQIVPMYQHYALAEKIYKQMMASVDEEISEDEARIMEALVLFVSEREKADEIKGMIDYGYTFERLAGTYTELDSFRETFGRGVYPESVDQVVFNLDTDEVSDMIEVDNGYYFFQCKSKYLVEESEANKEIIIQKRRAAVYEDVMESTKGKYESRLYEENWDRLTLKSEETIENAYFFETLSKYL